MFAALPYPNTHPIKNMTATLPTLPTSQKQSSPKSPRSRTKIRLVRVTKEELRDCIQIAYSGDEQMKKIHILEDPTLEEMTDYTWIQSVTDMEAYGTKLYRVVLPDGTSIGYTTMVLHPVKMLFTFGINIEYRKPEIMDGWMKALEQHLGYQFSLTLRTSNQRAVKFFVKRKFEVAEIEGGYLLYRKIWH